MKYFYLQAFNYFISSTIMLYFTQSLRLHSWVQVKDFSHHCSMCTEIFNHLKFKHNSVSRHTAGLLLVVGSWSLNPTIRTGDCRKTFTEWGRPIFGSRLFSSLLTDTWNCKLEKVSALLLGDEEPIEDDAAIAERCGKTDRERLQSALLWKEVDKFMGSLQSLWGYSRNQAMPSRWRRKGQEERPHELLEASGTGISNRREHVGTLSLSLCEFWESKPLICWYSQGDWRQTLPNFLHVSIGVTWKQRVDIFMFLRLWEPGQIGKVTESRMFKGTLWIWNFWYSWTKSGPLWNIGWLLL